MALHFRRYFKAGWLLLVAFLLLVSCREQDGPDGVFQGPLPDGAAARLGKGEIIALAFAPSADRLFAGSRVGVTSYAADTLVEQWQAATQAAVREVASTPDGQRLLVGLDDGTLLLLDGQDGALLQSWAGYAGGIGVSALAWQQAAGADGYRAVAGFDDGNMLLLRIAGSEVETIGGLPRQRSKITALAFNPDGRILATGNNGGRLFLIDLASQMLLADLAGHDPGKAVEAIAWSPDGAAMISGSKDGVVVEWDLTDLAAAQIWPAEEGSVLTVGYFADGERLVMATNAGMLEQWQAGQTVDGLRMDVGAPLLAAAWDGRHARYATAGDDGLLQVWAVPQSGDWPEEALAVRAGHAPHAAQVLVVAFAPQGARLLSNLGSEAIIWQPPLGGRAVTFNEHEANISAAAWSPDGRRVASADRDGLIYIWQAADGQSVQTLEYHTRPVTGLSWSPDGSLLASAGSLADELVIWDVASGEALHILEGAGDGLWSAAWSPDGQRLAAGSTEGRLYLWDTDDFTAEPQELWRHQAWISAIAWRENSRELVTGAGDAMVLIWNLAQRNSAPLPGHEAPVRGVAFSPDGSQLVSAAIDGEAILWNSEPRAQEVSLATLHGHTDGMTAVDWSSDGRYIATGSEDGTVLIWEIPALEEG